jgi:hypothetical protein
VHLGCNIIRPVACQCSPGCRVASIAACAVLPHVGVPGRGAQWAAACSSPEVRLVSSVWRVPCRESTAQSVLYREHGVCTCCQVEMRGEGQGLQLRHAAWLASVSQGTAHPPVTAVCCCSSRGRCRGSLDATFKALCHGRICRLQCTGIQYSTSVFQRQCMQLKHSPRNQRPRGMSQMRRLPSRRCWQHVLRRGGLSLRASAHLVLCTGGTCTAHVVAAAGTDVGSRLPGARQGTGTVLDGCHLGGSNVANG